MVDRYVLDTSALIAFVQNEPGAETVGKILRRAEEKTATVFISFITLAELYYIIWQEEGESAAKELIVLVKSLPISIIESQERVTLFAGRLKAKFRLSLADAFVAATALIITGVLIHKDPELEQVNKLMTTEPLPFKSKKNKTA